MLCVRSLLRGCGQVMFQNNALAGLFFLAGILWGAWEAGMPQVAAGAAAGLAASTLAGYIMGEDSYEGLDGLWGFNGVLVGCALPLFLAPSWQMWAALVLCAMATTWVRRGLDMALGLVGTGSLTFPFVLMTWIFLLASGGLGGLEPASAPSQTAVPGFEPRLLAVWWLKGLSQVFLMDSWISGLLFLAGLAVSSLRAALWASAGSAMALGFAFAFGADGEVVSTGLFGYNAVLTAIALGSVAGTSGLRSVLWTVAAVLTALFVQYGVVSLTGVWGIPALTAPFCVATWLFVVPRRKSATL